MKGVERMKANLGGNIRESMGAAGPGDSTLPPIGPRGGSAPVQGATRPKDVLTIEIGRLVPDPQQPRKEFDPESIAELAASLKDHGQLQSIRVRRDGAESRWVITDGERRFRAAQLAGLPALLCVEAKGSSSPDDVLEEQLVANCLREDLKPIEQAHAYKRLLEARGWSNRYLAERLHISHMAVNRALALLELPAVVQEQVEQGTLPPATAYEVSKLESTEAQAEVAAEIVSAKLTRAEAAKAVQRRANKAKGRAASKARKVTSRMLRTSGGHKITVEHRRGLELATTLAALEEAAARIRTELGSERAA
jgi:ParB family chromosome partitioning protein